MTAAVIGRHSLDPEAPHRAAPLLGRLVAQGLLARREALDALLHAPAEGVSRSGLQSRLTHALDAAAHALRRAATEHAVRRAVAAPLLARVPRAALLAAADAADPECHLLPCERRAVVEAEVAWAIRAARVARR